MVRLKIKIDKERDLPVLQALFEQRGLKYDVEEDDDLTDISESKIEEIKDCDAKINADRSL